MTMEAANTTAMTHMEIIHVPVMMTTSLTAMDKHVKVLYIARTHTIVMILAPSHSQITKTACRYAL